MSQKALLEACRTKSCLRKWFKCSTCSKVSQDVFLTLSHVLCLRMYCLKSMICIYVSQEVLCPDECFVPLAKLRLKRKYNFSVLPMPLSRLHGYIRRRSESSHFLQNAKFVNQMLVFSVVLLFIFVICHLTFSDSFAGTPGLNCREMRKTITIEVSKEHVCIYIHILYLFMKVYFFQRQIIAFQDICEQGFVKS